MRILHVHSGNIFGGVERILIALAGHDRFSPNFKHTFALAFHGRLEESLSAAGARVFGIPPFKLSKPWQVHRARAAIRAVLAAQRFDLAIVHSAWAHAAFCGLLQAAGLPVLFWLHTTATAQSWMERAAQLRQPNRVLSVSAAVDKSAQLLFPGVPSDIVHSPLTVDESAFQNADRDEVRASLGARPDDVIVVQASRLEPWKGHPVLLRALAGIPAHLNWRCWIAGGAESAEEVLYLEKLQALTGELSLSGRLQFLGARSDVPALLKGADIYCQANTEGEGFSIAFLEASYAALPIVTSALGGASEIVDAKNGFLLPPGDIEAFSDALTALIESTTLRQSLGETGRRRALERCNPARQFAALEKVFLITAANHV